jgi:hypothetical protein
MARRSHRRHTGRHGSALANASRRVARARRLVLGMMVSRGGLAVIRDLGAPAARCAIKRTAVDVAGYGRVNRCKSGGVIVLHSAIPFRGHPWQHYATSGDPKVGMPPLGRAL